MHPVGLSLSEAIERFRRHAGDTEAARLYLSLLEGARARWEPAIEVHDWRLDLLSLRARGRDSQQIQVDYRRRDGEPIVVFSLGPPGMNASPAVTGDICRPETAPQVLDAFLLQIAQPAS